MSKLNEIRKRINEIDTQMAKLFVERMNASKEVAAFKIENALPIYDAEREQEVINNNSLMIENLELREYYVQFLKDLMNVSKKYQYRIMEGMIVGYSGVEGAFGYIAAKRMFPTAKLVAYPDFVDAYRDCENGKCDVSLKSTMCSAWLATARAWIFRRKRMSRMRTL